MNEEAGRENIFSSFFSIILHIIILASFLLIRSTHYNMKNDNVEVNIYTPMTAVNEGEGGGGGGGGTGDKATHIAEGNNDANSKFLSTGTNVEKIGNSVKVNKNEKNIVPPQIKNAKDEQIKSNISGTAKGNAATGLVGASSKTGKVKNGGKGGGQGTGLGTGNGSGTGSGTGSGSGSGIGSGSGSGIGSGTGDGYSIFGLGLRKIRSAPLPKYPDGVSVEGNVKLKFEILPDGSVGDIWVMKRLNPRLENAAINSLKRWRFAAYKDKQTVNIIFPFRLR